MKITIKVNRDEVWESLYLPFCVLFSKNKRRWETVGAAVSLGGGLLCPVAGGVLSLIASYTRLGFERPVLYKIGLGFYILTVPLLMLGAHFLDLLEKKSVEIRQNEARAPER